MQPDRSERGDTLIEVLMTLVVLSIAVLGLIIAFGTSLSASVDHRGLATNDVVLRSTAETAITEIQQQSNPLYVSCGHPNDYGSANNFGAPSGYTAIVTAVTYWQASSASFVGSPCTANAPELLTLTVTNTSKGTQVWTSFVVDARGNAASSALSVTAVSPSSLTAGAAAQTLSITGTNFVNGAMVSFSNSGVHVNSATFVNSTTINVNVSVSSSAPTGAGTITVTNPSTSAATSGPIFSVSANSTVLHVSSMVGAPGGSTHAWDAHVTVYVVDSNGNAIPGVIVTGIWNHPDPQYDETCKTDASGSCQVGDGAPDQINAGPTLTFTVNSGSGLSKTGYTYNSAVDFPSSASVSISHP